MRLPCLLFATALTLSAVPAVAQQSSVPPAGERLLLDPPNGWTAVQVQRTEKMIIHRLYPPGENQNQWTQTVTIQMYPTSDQMPRAFIEGIIAYSRDNCEAVGPGPVSETANNGYPQAIVTVTCTKGRGSGMGSFALIQAIRGKEGLYVVQRQWRGPAFGRNEAPAFPSNMLKDWGEFTRTVSLCDSRDQQHPCP